MLSRLTLALAWVALAVVAFAQHRPANQGLPIVHADFPLCVTIKPPPLLRSPDNAHDFRLGRPFNDKGTA
jgi:hypothetical protein